MSRLSTDQCRELADALVAQANGLRALARRHGYMRLDHEPCRSDRMIEKSLVIAEGALMSAANFVHLIRDQELARVGRDEAREKTA